MTDPSLRSADQTAPPSIAPDSKLVTAGQSSAAKLPTDTHPERHSGSHFRELSPSKIVDTVAQLERRIGERFPVAGLRNVAREVTKLAEEAVVRCDKIRRPNYGIRLISVLLILGAVVGLGVVVGRLRFDNELSKVDVFAQFFESTLGSLFFIGATLAFVWTLEARIKRGRVLTALRELRALAHIVDMHQLTKDPETVTRAAPTPSSPKRTLTPIELTRYLDYCSELLSVLSKIGELYVQGTADPDSLEAADQLSALTNGLSRNIWQKIVILDRSLRDQALPH